MSSIPLLPQGMSSNPQAFNVLTLDECTSTYRILRESTTTKMWKQKKSYQPITGWEYHTDTTQTSSRTAVLAAKRMQTPQILK